MCSIQPIVPQITFPSPMSQIGLGSFDPIDTYLEIDRNYFKMPSVHTGFWTSRPVVVLTQSEYEEIRDLPKETPFSEILDKYDLGKVLTLLSRPAIEMKFNAEFGILTDAELVNKCDAATLKKFHLHKLLPDDRMEKLNEIRKEAVRMETAPFSELVQKYGFSLVADCFSEEELESMLLQECAGKEAKEILAKADIVFLTSKLGQKLIRERCGEILKNGPVEVEAEGLTRTFTLTDDTYSFVETKQYPDGGESRIKINCTETN